METDSRKQILSLSSHPRRSRRETPGWKDDGELSGLQPGCGFTEGRHEVPVALVELPADLPARRVEPGSGGLLQRLGCCMRLLLPNRRSTSGRQIEELSLQGSLALDVVDPLRNPPPVLLGREMRPAGEGLGRADNI